MIRPRPRKRVKATISLRAWIEEMGIQKVARLLDVNDSTVSHWKTGRVLPKDDQKRFIKNFTNGRVSYEQIIEGHPNREAAT